MITKSTHYKYALRATALTAQFAAGMLLGASSAFIHCNVAGLTGVQE